LPNVTMPVEEVGKAFSDQIRQRAPVRGDKWHMDEVGHLDCWRAVLAVARRRSKWLRSRRLDPSSKRQSRCAAVHEEALEIRRHTAARHDHGQAPFMRRCEGARWAFASTSPAQGPEQSHGEQSRGKLSPADKATRTDHEAIQSARQAQRFLSVHDQVANLFHIPYPKSVPADFRRSSRERAFAAWREISKTGATAQLISQKNRLLGPAFAQLYDTGVAKGVNRAARSLRIARFVNEKLFRSDLAAEKSERPRDYDGGLYIGHFRSFP
jgi:putative transposase